MTPLPWLLLTSATLLECIDSLGPLVVQCSPPRDQVRFQIEGDAPLADKRTLVDRFGSVLGVQGRLFEHTPRLREYRVDGIWEGLPVRVTASAGPGPWAPKAPRIRATAPVVSLLTSLASWAQALEVTPYSLVVHSSEAQLRVMAFVKDPYDPQRAMDAVLSGLPAQLEPHGIGSGTDALLPTGHTLTVISI